MGIRFYLNIVHGTRILLLFFVVMKHSDLLEKHMCLLISVDVS